MKWFNEIIFNQTPKVLFGFIIISFNFQFHNKVSHLNIPDDYSMPHWINLSFYSSNKKIAYSTFVPRIKLPPPINEGIRKDSPKPKILTEEEYIHNTFFDYDGYDAKVFQLPSAHPTTENA